MSPRTGRPKMENAKDTMFRVRLDDKTIEDLDFCAKSLDTTKSEIVRKGIKLVKSEIEANKFTKIPWLMNIQMLIYEYPKLSRR